MITESSGDISLFVEAGALIPRRPYALSTAFIDKAHLKLDVYAGADGRYALLEDDDRSEAYRQGRVRRTKMAWDDPNMTLEIAASEGGFDGSPDHRKYDLRFLGVPPIKRALVNDQGTEVTYQDGVATLTLAALPVGGSIKVQLLPTARSQ